MSLVVKMWVRMSCRKSELEDQNLWWLIWKSVSRYDKTANNAQWSRSIEYHEYKLYKDFVHIFYSFGWHFLNLVSICLGNICKRYREYFMWVWINEGLVLWLVSCKGWECALMLQKPSPRPQRKSLESLKIAIVFDFFDKLLDNMSL